MSFAIYRNEYPDEKARLRVRHQEVCAACRTGVPCFAWFKIDEPLPTLSPADPLIYVERGQVFNATVQVCGTHYIHLSVDYGGVFVGRKTAVAQEHVKWVRLPCYQTDVDALEAAAALVDA